MLNTVPDTFQMPDPLGTPTGQGQPAEGRLHGKATYVHIQFTFLRFPVGLEKLDKSTK